MIRARDLNTLRFLLVLSPGVLLANHGISAVHAKQAGSDTTGQDQRQQSARDRPFTMGDLVRYRTPFWYSSLTEGRVVSVSGESLRVRTVDSIETSVATNVAWRLEVRRTHRPMLQGATWGAGIGAAAGLLATIGLAIASGGSGAFDPDFTPYIPRVFAGCVAGGAVLGLLAGTGRHVRWERVDGAALMSGHARQTMYPGLRLSRRF